MKVGIPKALLYHYYFPFWKTYFEELGFEVMVSASTNKAIMDLGVKASVPEICVPIKVYLGHVLSLAERGADWLFIPRFVSIQKGQFFCPKFMGLPDMVRHSFPHLASRLLIPSVESSTDDLATSVKQYQIMEEKLGVSRSDSRRALRKAEAVWLDFRRWSLKGYEVPEAMTMALNKTQGNIIEKETVDAGHQQEITLGVLGYVYNLYDSMISLDILSRLREMGVRVETFEMVPERALRQQLTGMPKTMFWTFSDKLFAAGYHFFEKPEIDGLIHVTAFGCGPDSMLGKLLELDSVKFQKPFMTVRIDEHSGENHLQTRIEAFVDMLRLKKQMNAQRGA
ncbi:acyl-CoA dehydratase activase-related protein [Anoxynatronum buryatiense]|uniref:Predicted nucleotide-binding protein, sugar kinase/HSP70/actin superfamily n=1 Tax=Anoxynatronum buryatiense TaxID=489973 RepID=A0AA45WTL0_9CLOT|nr:acyl-CoA dehydratase activase-related protein [Anoxynatronum buryatiense]SMP41373.1 Predicted nucleotide-binding protein, sugar kinase/HSP70/actin superfamily [Anoxynatronum buryatiense]